MEMRALIISKRTFRFEIFWKNILYSFSLLSLHNFLFLKFILRVSLLLMVQIHKIIKIFEISIRVEKCLIPYVCLYAGGKYVNFSSLSFSLFSFSFFFVWLGGNYFYSLFFFKFIFSLSNPL
jgi:hypothetical protein